jgi:hypothetical protein
MSDHWITPQSLIQAVGPFDLDPCAAPSSLAKPRPWSTALQHLTEGGLQANWGDKCVWLNPPYSNVEPWINKLSRHGNGIALVMAATDTAWFNEHVWPFADSLLFLVGRVTYYRVDGSRAHYNSGHASCLIAYGDACKGRLWKSGLAGTLIMGPVPASGEPGHAMCVRCGGTQLASDLV